MSARSPQYVEALERWHRSLTRAVWVVALVPVVVIVAVVLGAYLTRS